MEFEEVNYMVDRLSKAKLKELVKMMGITPRELLRKKEAAYKKLDLGNPDLSDTKIIDAMAAHPELIQRPIVVRGKKAVLARPVDRVKELL